MVLTKARLLKQDMPVHGFLSDQDMQDKNARTSRPQEAGRKQHPMHWVSEHST